MRAVIRHLRTVALGSKGDGPTDSQLLEYFIVRRDETAFAVLVRRHGPMVLGVCQRLRRNVHDAEDAFQATFLVKVGDNLFVVAAGLFKSVSQTARRTVSRSPDGSHGRA